MNTRLRPSSGSFSGGMLIPVDPVVERPRVAQRDAENVFGWLKLILEKGSRHAS
jgi:hypothetical protein